MIVSERIAFNNDLTSLVGQTKDSELLRGGDLCIFTVDQQQSLALINLNNTLVGPRKITTSLTKSAQSIRGIIRNVPIHDSDFEIAEALKLQGVVSARSIHPNSAISSIPSGNVILSFSTPLPDRVKMSNISYPVQLFIPNPFRCVSCWRLGHTKALCKLSSPTCKRCGNTHSSDIPCQIRCINCGCSDHEADSVLCPSYVEMKKVLRIATIENISIRDAKKLINSSSPSFSSNICMNTSPHHSPAPSEF